jgi:hypothetical protein
VIKTESNDTGHDLFGVDFGLAVGISAHDICCGFDNSGEVVCTSPLWFEKRPSVTECLLEDSFVIADPQRVTKGHFDGIRAHLLKSRGAFGTTVSLDEDDDPFRRNVVGNLIGRTPVRPHRFGDEVPNTGGGIELPKL